MIKLDENHLIDWIYSIISKIDDPSQVREELMKLASFVANAPRLTGEGAYPKTKIL